MSFVASLAMGTGMVAIGALGRRHAARRIEELVARRLPRGSDGVIEGAGGLSLSGGSNAALVLHGFGDTAQSVRALAEYLSSQGWTVSAPLLPGHGRSLQEFAQSRAGEWLACAREEFKQLRARHGEVAIVGQSMGGALAVLLAAELRDARALVLLAPYLTMLPAVARLARRPRLVGLLVPYLYSRAEASIRDPIERSRSLGYGYVPPRALAELLTLTRDAWDAAPEVKVPTLVMQSQFDNRIDAAEAARAFERLGASPKVLHWFADRGHVLAVDVGREEVFTRTEYWLRHGGPG